MTALQNYRGELYMNGSNPEALNKVNDLVQNIEDEMEYEEMMRRNQHNYMERQQMDTIYDEIQQPVIFSILFFLFQLPFFNKTLLKFVPTLFKPDGHPKFTGYLLKTVLFGVTVFLANKTFDMVSEF